MAKHRRGGRSVAQQGFALRARFPASEIALRRDRLCWTGALQPTPLSRTYQVRVGYALGQMPLVRVVSPLISRPGEQLPHTWQDGSLCLHESSEWSSRMAIADTIVPWAAEWLLFYEIWLATGSWEGGGEWPPRSAPRGEGGKERDPSLGEGAPASPWSVSVAPPSLARVPYAP